MHVVAAGTTRLLWGSTQNNQAALYPLQHIHYIWNTCIASITINVFEMVRKCLVVQGQYSPTDQPACSPPQQQLPNNLATCTWSLHECSRKTESLPTHFSEILLPSQLNKTLHFREHHYIIKVSVTLPHKAGEILKHTPAWADFIPQVFKTQLLQCIYWSLKYSSILYFAHTAHLCVSKVFQDKQWLLFSAR